MTLFSELSFTCRVVFGLWTFLLCLSGIVGAVLSFVGRRYRNILLFFPVFTLAYLLWQVTVCILYISEDELTSTLCLWIAHLPYIDWLLLLVALTLGTAVLLYVDIRYLRTFITPLTLARYADELTCGICYWQDNGHVVFSNDCINTLGIQLTGRSLMDRKRLRNAITEPMMPVGDRVWQFVFRDIAYGREMLHELIAFDVSELYAESYKLQVDNDKLAKMNEELKGYSLRIDDTVRRQEMLQAKVNIHDEMNRLMLSTIAADLDNETELNRIFTLWERNALFLCMASKEQRNEDAVKQLEQLSQALRIQIVWQNDLTARLSQKNQELFFAAAQEAITNAVKHAKAQRIQISFTETQKHIRCTFENDGDIPGGDIHFTGGLANLSVLAEDQHAAVSAKSDETYILSLTFRKNE